MKLTWFGHSAFRVEFGDARILIDPFLSGNPSFTGEVADASAGVTHVLLTHGHSDHSGDVVDVCTSNDATLVGSAEICRWFGSEGVRKTEPGNHGGTIDCGGFTVSFVNALHSAGGSDEGKPLYLGNPHGLIVKAPGEPVLYHMGDTDIFGDMALVNEIHQPEIGIVPIGDRFTMGARTASMACKRFFDFRAIVPCHYGTFPIIDPTADKFLAEMGNEAGKVIVPPIGEPFEV